METFAYKGKQRKRKNVVITLDPELVEKAKELGLNISKVCENALIQAVKALEEAFNEKGGNLGTVGSWNWSLGRDLNPRPSPYQGDALTGLGHRGTQNILIRISLFKG